MELQETNVLLVQVLVPLADPGEGDGLPASEGNWQGNCSASQGTAAIAAIAAQEQGRRFPQPPATPASKKWDFSTLQQPGRADGSSCWLWLHST